jgi:manganese/zinc/iron transport system permease protein
MTAGLAPWVAAVSDHAWILLTAAVVGVSCSLLGSYLVLRRVSLLGDALAHAVLPGLVLAFIWSGSLAIGYMLLGAFLIGLLTTFLTQSLQRWGGVTADSSMGIVFTSLFALGVVLIKRYAQGVDLDAECVLQGQLGLVPGFRVDVGGLSIPRALATALPMLAINLAVVALFWKELQISSFDPALAETMGLRAGWMHYLLMALVAATAVSAFEAVGSILVVAMLIVPGAVAHLLCDRLASLLLVAAGVALTVAVLGYGWSLRLDAEPAGMMSVVAGLAFAAAALFAPRYGLVSKIWHNLQIARRIVREDLLALLFRVEELGAPRRLEAADAVHALGGGIQPRWELWRLVRRGLVTHLGGHLALTDLGRRRAAQLVRTHRLWEAYLVQFLGLPLDHVHAPAERMEHYIHPELEEQIVAGLAESAIDPHGREIPQPGPSG